MVLLTLQEVKTSTRTHLPRHFCSPKHPEWKLSLKLASYPHRGSAAASPVQWRLPSSSALQAPDASQQAVGVGEAMGRKGFQLTVQLLPNMAFIWSNDLYCVQSRDSWEYLMLTLNEGLSWKAPSRSWHIFLGSERLLQHWLNVSIQDEDSSSFYRQQTSKIANNAQSPRLARGFSTSRVTSLG